MSDVPGWRGSSQWSLVRVLLPGQEMNPLTLLLSEETYEIGRLDGAGRIKVSGSGFISKKHCKIYLRNGIWRLLDMGSMNGTFLNGVRIFEERELRQGDLVGLGVHQLNLNLERPYEAYFMFRFVQVVAHLEIPVIPCSNRIEIKQETPEVITIPSDDEEPLLKPTIYTLPPPTITKEILKQESFVPKSELDPVNPITREGQALTSCSGTELAAGNQLETSDREHKRKLVVNVKEETYEASKQSMESSPVKKYRRIMSIPSSSSSSDEHVSDEMDHTDNPYAVPPVTIEPPLSSINLLQMSPPTAKLIERLRRHPPKLLVTPVISFSKRGSILLTLPKEWKQNLDSNSLKRAKLQFKASCARNDVNVYDDNTPVNGLGKGLKSNTTAPVDPDCFKTDKKIPTGSSVLPIPPKATRLHDDFVEPKLPPRVSSETSIKSDRANTSHQQTTKSFPYLPSASSSFQRRPSTSNITPVSGLLNRQAPKTIKNMGSPAAQAILSSVQKPSLQQEHSSGDRIRPEATQKDYNAITKNISKKHANSRHCIKFIPSPLERYKKRKRGCFSSNGIPAPQAAHVVDNSISPASLTKERSERLYQLATVNKRPMAEVSQQPKPPPPKISKTTKPSRMDLLIDAIAPTGSDPVASSHTQSDKWKVAKIAPLSNNSNSKNLHSSTAVVVGSVKDNSSGIVGPRPSVSGSPTALTANAVQYMPIAITEKPIVHATAANTVDGCSTSHGLHRVSGFPSRTATLDFAFSENSKAVLSYDANKPTLTGPPNVQRVCDITSSERLPEDQVYRDTLMWNPQWLQEQSANKKPPPVVHGRPMLTNLPFYKDYESYKNTFYPLMLLELWAAIFQDSTTELERQKFRQGMESRELLVGIERIDHSHFCPLLLNPNQPLNQLQLRQKEQEAAGKSNPQYPFYHCVRLVALVDRMGAINRDLDFGTVTFDFHRSSGDVQPFTFFAFFQDPQYEQINSMTILPPCLDRYRGSKKFKVIIPTVTHVKYDLNKILCANVGKIRKIAYISSKIRDFRALSQLPDSSLFTHILYPPKCTEEQVLKIDAVPRSELVSSIYDTLNPVQRSVVHHISRRILKVQGADLMLLHGPAGTGKTRTIVALLLQLTLDYRQNNPAKQVKILVCTPSNTAVDEIIRRLTKQAQGLKIVRIGGGSSVAQDTRKFTLDEAAKPYLSSTGQIESISESIAAVERKIEKAARELSQLKTDSNKTSTVVSALEASIAEWQRDRNMYISDLNTMKADKKGMEQAKRSVITNAQIVFSTLNSCSSGQLRRQFKKSIEGRRQDAKTGLLFTCCIVDESTQTTEPESLAPLMLGCEKLILVGDPKQLPATVLSAEAESKKFRQSLFTRIFNHYEENEPGGSNPVMMLTIQYRMHREILKWPNEWFYGKRLQTHPSVDRRPPLEIRPYLFLNIAGKETNVQNGQISNDEEIKFLKEILKILQSYSQIYPSHRNLTIGVITPYNEQRRKVCEVLNEIKRDNNAIGFHVEVDTVDSFQGREKDIILFSCVRTSDLGFVKTPERLNVALTRAKQSLIIVGNAHCLHVNTMWGSLMDDAQQRGHYHTIPSDYARRPNLNLSSYVENVLTRKSPSKSFVETEYEGSKFKR